jgi:hypothetical protein
MVKPPHRLSHVLGREDSRVLRVTLFDGGIFRLSDFEQVDPSIYGDTDRWSARVEEAVAGSHPDFKRLHRPGSLLDLHESDITEVLDESSGEVCYHATPTI